MIKKLKKIFTGEFIDELFSFDSNSNNNLGSFNTKTSQRGYQSQTSSMVVKSESQTKKHKRIFEGDCV